MSDAQEKRVVVVGAGLVGAITSVFLGRRGYKVTMYEGRADPRLHAAVCDNAMLGRLTNATKRSINLALSHRGLCALKKVGLEEQVLKAAVPMEGRMIHPRGQSDVSKGSIFQPYEHKPGHAIYSISREELNFALLEEADKMANVTTVFSAKFEHYDEKASAVVFKVGEGEQASRVTVTCDFVVGADGAFSKVREALGRVERLNFSRQYISTAYKEFSIPPNAAGEFAMEPHGTQHLQYWYKNI
jgi:kynurenine 3-monooxygenase